MKKYVLIIFIVFMAFSICFAEGDFEDIDNHWANKEIETLVRDGSITGYQDNTFKPNNPIRVDEFLKIIITETKLKLYRQGESWSETYSLAAIDHGMISPGDFKEYNRLIKRYDT